MLKWSEFFIPLCICALCNVIFQFFPIRDGSYFLTPELDRSLWFVLANKYSRSDKPVPSLGHNRCVLCSLAWNSTNSMWTSQACWETRDHIKENQCTPANSQPTPDGEALGWTTTESGHLIWDHGTIKGLRRGPISLMQ